MTDYAKPTFTVNDLIENLQMLVAENPAIGELGVGLEAGEETDYLERIDVANNWPYTRSGVNPDTDNLDYEMDELPFDILFLRGY